MKLRFSLLSLALTTFLITTGCGGRGASAPAAFQDPSVPVVMNSSTPIVIATTQNDFVGTNRTIFVQFSHDMDPTSINTNTFIVTGVTGSVSYDAPNRIGVFKAASEFAISTVYHYSITTGARDIHGIHLPQTFTSAFRTRSTLD